MSMNFDPAKLRTDSTFKGKPLKRQVKKTIFWNGKQKYELASIPKENLSFAPFQRPKDSPRQNKIAENFHKDFALANVAEEFYNGLWYYTVTDAQQRSYANPEDHIGCVVTNGMPPADAFMLGNSNGKPLTKDDKLWARFEMGQNDHLWFFDTISSYGFTPYRATGDDGKINKSLGRFIGSVALHDAFCKVRKVTNNPEFKAELKELNSENETFELDDALETVSRERFDALCQVMTALWDVDDFCPDSEAPANQNKRRSSAYRDVWFAMIPIMSEFGWDNQDKIVECLSKGYFRKNNKGAVREEQCRSMEEVVSHAYRHYSEITSVSGGEGSRQLAYSRVLWSMYMTGLQNQ